MYLQTIICVTLWLVTSIQWGDIRELKKSFPKEWRRAEQRIGENRSGWNKIFESLDADAQVCEAIIFPELLRYSNLQNGMEEGANIALYVRGGVDAANFSVGYFQMKPSFLEEVEKGWMKSPLRHIYKLYFDVSDTQMSRKKRLDRLLDEDWQCVYLAIFYRLVMERIPELEEIPPYERVLLLATAYNRDFDATLEQLYQMSEEYMFHTDIFSGENTEYHSYGEISVTWYRHINMK